MGQTIGERIKFLRESKGWSQDDLANQLGLCREALSRIENSHRALKAEELAPLADLLNVTTDQLLGRQPLPSIQLDKTPKDIQTTRISVPEKNVTKFREVLLYILTKVGAKPNIGETVLYKLIYFIDFDYYEKYEEQLIGATYIKNTFGPTPVEFISIINQMIEKGEVERVKSSYFKKEQTKYLPHRNAQLDLLSAKEIKLIDEVLARLADKNASQISEYSHGDIPWVVTEDQCVIDYETVFYRTPQYSTRKSEDPPISQ